MTRALLLLMLLMPGLPALAQEAAPLYYSRSVIEIKRAQLPIRPMMPWQKQEDLPPPPELMLDVEVRDAATLYQQEGWFNLSSLSDSNGVLMVFSAPTAAPIRPMSQYAPLDILMIDKHGVIKQIAPKLVLSELSEDIVPQAPVLAFLFMAGGACQRLSINPGDIVIYKIFKKPPPVLVAPAGTQNPPHSEDQGLP